MPQRDYPASYDQVAECVGCGDEFPNATESPDHPHKPLVNGCCSWECYATALECKVVKLKEWLGGDNDTSRGDADRLPSVPRETP